jgi:hypothetical protein
MSYTLKRDGWHFRLQKWVFGEDMPRFDNFCPFFWLTIFCMMASPFVGAWKLLRKTLRLVSIPIDYMSRPIESLVDWVASKRNVRYERRIVTFANTTTDWKAYQIFKIIHGWRYYYRSGLDLDTNYTTIEFDKMRESKRSMYKGCLEAWKNKHKDWRDRILDCHKREMELINAEKNKKNARRAKFAKLAQHTKILVWLPIGVATIYLSYWSGLLVLVCIDNPDTFFYVMRLIGITLIGVALFVGACVFMARNGWFDADVGKPFKAIGRVIWFPIKLTIVPICSFLWMNVKAFKENYCPSIEWQE